jgi:hypothetical protein
MKKIKGVACLKNCGSLCSIRVLQEGLISITKKGMRGAEEIAEMMKGYRDNPPATINSSPVVQLLDYQMQVGKNIQTGMFGILNFQKVMSCSLYWKMELKYLQDRVAPN